MSTAERDRRQALGANVRVLVAALIQQAAPMPPPSSTASKVLLADAAPSGTCWRNNRALIVSLAQPYETMMAAATSERQNIMPRVAALLDVMQISKVIKVVAPDTSSADPRRRDPDRVAPAIQESDQPCAPPPSRRPAKAARAVEAAPASPIPAFPLYRRGAFEVGTAGTGLAKIIISGGR